MIAGKKVLAVIPARGGSKRVPRKNVRDVGGKPLIAWTIEVAHQSQYIDRCVLSSDDDEIMAVAKTYGCDVPFRRPDALAQDETPGVQPIVHALEALPGYDYVVLLQPTSPLRSVADVDGAIRLCHAKRAPACVSVTESAKSPYWMYTMDSAQQLLPLLSPPAVPDNRPIVVLNGAVYVSDCTWLLRQRTFVTAETIAYPMPPARSVDVDTELDLAMAEFMLSHFKQNVIE